MKPAPLLTRAATILCLGMMLCGCNAGGGGGGGGGGDGGTGNDDPLPEYQLGQGDEEFDANVATIAQADNESLECFERMDSGHQSSMLFIVHTKVASCEDQSAQTIFSNSS